MQNQNHPILLLQTSALLHNLLDYNINIFLLLLAIFGLRTYILQYKEEHCDLQYPTPSLSAIVMLYTCFYINHSYLSEECFPAQCAHVCMSVRPSVCPLCFLCRGVLYCLSVYLPHLYHGLCVCKYTLHVQLCVRLSVCHIHVKNATKDKVISKKTQLPCDSRHWSKK